MLEWRYPPARKERCRDWHCISWAPRGIELDGVPVSVDRRKGVALLAYLGVTAWMHSRDALATRFWPEHDQVTARANLRRTLSMLNASLRRAWLAIDRVNVALPPADGLWVDVVEFRRCLTECHTNGYPDSTICPQCVSRLEAASSLYADDFLAGFTLPDVPDFDDWQFRQAESLRLELSDTLARLARCQAARRQLRARRSTTRDVAWRWTLCTSPASAS